jgi:hypothetical protein
LDEATLSDPVTFFGEAIRLPILIAALQNREDWPPRVRRRLASAYLEEVHGVQEAPATLAKKACLGGGPIFELFGRVPYYRTEALDSYAESRLSGPRRSTSDRGKVRG